MKRKITINDIAKLAGVSKTTVSFYLNGRYERMSEETRNRIQTVIEKTNYHPNTLARSLNFKQTRLVGVIIGDITNSFANQIVKGINDELNRHSYQMIVGSSAYLLENERKYVNGMSAMGVDGFIVQPTVHFETMWTQIGSERPIVYFDSPTATDDKRLWVKTNNYEAVYNATEKMAEEGYEKFVMISADPYVLNTRMERCRGFTDYLDIHKLPYEMVIADAATTPAEIESRLEPYLNKKASTCIFVANNWLLDKTYLVLRNYRDLIPVHVGLIGFDSLEWTELAVPSITTIVQPAYDEGRTAARLLIDRIEGKNQEVPNQILDCRINALDSTGRKKYLSAGV